MTETHLINCPEYWKLSSVRPRGFREFCEMIPSDGRVKGIWEWTQWDARTGEIVKRDWNYNAVTDDGATEIFKCAITNAVPAAVFNNIYINNNSGSTVLSSATGTGAIATGANLSVAALPASVPLNYPAPANAVVEQVTLGYGTGTTQVLNINGSNSQGATSLNIVGFTPTINYPVGTAVVPLPNVAENPSNANLKAQQSGVVEVYSGNLAGGAFTYSATTGAGNRSVQILFIFKNATNGGSTPNGNYTDSWLCNVSSAATTNNYVAHEINSVMRCDNFNNVTVQILLKI